MVKMLLVGFSACSVLLAAGCTDLKPVQSQLDDLKSQVSKLSSSETTTKAAADSAARSAQAAATAAYSSDRER
jgi:outer membrane murein-binding lipoprotein Lpp